ncbi:hypothetical protein LWF01_14350 [Saxibacter everestensis]|uniref:Uncharacterized protein n=1 Tax=Saxibacter everestensis TaxID=2909229 RepID=A0ABY8QSG5_9MICO|nr:hypothetical protein LWF01_14350 [Brevibacteriaceae bacterium ZFBP1038]
MDDSPTGDLRPDINAVTSLVGAITTNPWPSTDGELGNYFDLLGFIPTGQKESTETSAITETVLASALDPAQVHCMSFNGSLFSIGAFLYVPTPERPAQVETGYRAIHTELVARYGPPTEEDAPMGEDLRINGETSSFWRIGPTMIEMYCHLRQPAGVQLGISNFARNEAYEKQIISPAAHRRL